jgi:plasmid stability protein
METVLNLPAELVHRANVRAQQRGVSLDDAIAELLQRGLDATEESSEPAASIDHDTLTGLPVVRCSQSRADANRLTPDHIVELLLDQEAAWHHEVSRQ